MVRVLDWRKAVTGLALALGAAGCHELAVQNTNAPERERAFSDPATIITAASGTLKTYFNMRNSYDPTLTLASMAETNMAAWNNFNMRYYNSYGPGGVANCVDRCGWVNSTSTNLGFQVTPYWYGAYSVLSSANDALFALRVAATPPNLGNEAKKVETIAQMSQAMALAWVALNYDQGFIVLETSDLAALTIQPATAIRDKALELFETGITLAHANTFTTNDSWFGIGGARYTNLQLAKAMRTMQAELAAQFARSAEDDNTSAVWTKVVDYASKGTSSAVDGPAFEFNAHSDDNLTWFSGFQQWGNDFGTIRISNRVARLLSTTQTDPWPGGSGNPKPQIAGVPVGGLYGVDKRLGDGCFDAGTHAPNVNDNGECVATSLSGTDYAHMPDAIQNPARGQYHQSNIGYIRNHCLAAFFPDCPSGAGDVPWYSKGYNDILWAEGLLKTGGDKAVAAQLINNTRVTRGGLPAVSAATSTNDLLKALAYEQDVENVQISGNGYFNRRRQSKTTYAGPSGTNQYTADGKNHYMDAEGTWVLNTLWKDTPRVMPIPAKDLALLLQEIYSFGGPSDPGGTIPHPSASQGGSKVRNVREIYAEIERMNRERILLHRLGQR